MHGQKNIKSKKSIRGLFDPEEGISILRNIGSLLKDKVWHLRRPESQDWDCSLEGTQETFAV
jgi:hypothetical protein